MRARVAALAVLAACNGPAGTKDGPGSDGGTVPTEYTFPCAVAEPDDLPDPTSLIEDPHSCELDSPFPDNPFATSFYAGEYHMDECGNVIGREYWVLFANPRWVELGGHDCQVEWVIEGSTGDPVNQGDFSLSIHAEVDLAATTCSDIEGFDPDTAYEASFDQVYDVAVNGDGSSIYFTLTSTERFGEGPANDSHVTWLSGRKCQYF